MNYHIHPYISLNVKWTMPGESVNHKKIQWGSPWKNFKTPGRARLWDRRAGVPRGDDSAVKTGWGLGGPWWSLQVARKRSGRSLKSTTSAASFQQLAGKDVLCSVMFKTRMIGWVFWEETHPTWGDLKVISWVIHIHHWSIISQVSFSWLAGGAMVSLHLASTSLPHGWGGPILGKNGPLARRCWRFRPNDWDKTKHLYGAYAGEWLIETAGRWYGFVMLCPTNTSEDGQFNRRMVINHENFGADPGKSVAPGLLGRRQATHQQDFSDEQRMYHSPQHDLDRRGFQLRSCRWNGRNTHWEIAEDFVSQTQTIRSQERSFLLCCVAFEGFDWPWKDLTPRSPVFPQASTSTVWWGRTKILWKLPPAASTLSSWSKASFQAEPGVLEVLHLQL